MPKINVKPGIGRYNFMCHLNSVHDALNNDYNKIVMCIYIDENYPIIHFINVDNDGNYIDNTLGRWSEKFDYYFVKLIKKEDFFNINDIFTVYRKELRLKLPFYLRWFSNNKF